MILCCEILNLGIEYLADPDEETKARIQTMMDEFIGMPEILTDFGFKSAVESILEGRY
jgi:hypothetical protein